MVVIFCDYQSRDFERRDAPLGLRREAHAVETACGGVEATLVAMRTRLSTALARARLRSRGPACAGAPQTSTLCSRRTCACACGSASRCQSTCGSTVSARGVRVLMAKLKLKLMLLWVIVRESQIVDEYISETI